MCRPTPLFLSCYSVCQAMLVGHRLFYEVPRRLLVWWVCRSIASMGKFIVSTPLTLHDPQFVTSSAHAVRVDCAFANSEGNTYLRSQRTKSMTRKAHVTIAIYVGFVCDSTIVCWWMRIRAARVLVHKHIIRCGLMFGHNTVRYFEIWMHLFLNGRRIFRIKSKANRARIAILRYIRSIVA